MNAPIYHICLKSELVSACVEVAEVDSLPVRGVDLLLGNDIAGTRVNPEVSECPVYPVEMKEMEAEFQEVFTSCVVTRAQARVKPAVAPAPGALSSPWVDEEPMVELSDTVFPQWLTSGVPEGVLPSEVGGDKVAESDARGVVSRSEMSGAPDVSQHTLVQEQKEDPSLKYAVKVATSARESGDMATGYFVRRGILCRKWRPASRPASEDWASYEQIVLPQSYRGEVLRMAHGSVFGGHLGFKKTLAKISRQFYWPGLRKDVKGFCRRCHTCQVVGKQGSKPPVSPLQPLPVVREPFAEIMIDCVGPLPKTKKGNEYLLTILDTATRYPEAIPLRNIKTKVIVEHLLKFFAWVGLPRSIQSDRGSNFTAKLFHQVWSELNVVVKHSSPYHPQSQGAIERFHGTLKNMIRAFVEGQPKEWDEAIPFLLFAVRDAPTESLGFSPFELVFGHEVRGPLQLLREKIMRPAPPGDR